MHQSSFTYHAPPLSRDCKISSISGHTPVVPCRHDSASLTTLHLKCLCYFVQAAITPHPCMSTISFLHLFICHSHDPNIQPESVLINFVWSKVAFDLLSAHLDSQLNLFFIHAHQF